MDAAAQKSAVIIGAGPAGLTAAYELASRAGVRPIVIEKSRFMGGIARTVDYKGNRIDLGGHRFFSKSDRVMAWWLNMMPMQKLSEGEVSLTYHHAVHGLKTHEQGPDPDKEDRVMLLRSRKSRVYYRRQFFDYPIRLSPKTLRQLGPLASLRIAASYLRSVLKPIANEQNLEQFFINRFGKELYLTFFKSYTEKVWGVACRDISAEWGAQRIKGLSVAKAAAHFMKSLLPRTSGLSQKGTETSLIERFLYPKLGPGQMWEVTAAEIRRLGGEILTGHEVCRLRASDGRVAAVEIKDTATGEAKTIAGDYFFSTMPIQELIKRLSCPVPAPVQDVAAGLMYRDFITVGLLLKRLKLKDGADSSGLIKDNWIYIQEPDVLAGRLQIFNNWSPYMVADPGTAWIGVEYFCNDGDELWTKSDSAMAQFCVQEMSDIGVIEASEVLDSVVLRMPKTYPAYFGTYDRFSEIRSFLDGFGNLFPIGRNGMHKYNNQDHSMLTAMTAVDNIIAGRRDKSNLWDINTEEEYHEAKRAGSGASA